MPRIPKGKSSAIMPRRDCAPTRSRRRASSASTSPCLKRVSDRGLYQRKLLLPVILIGKRIPPIESGEALIKFNAARSVALHQGVQRGLRQRKETVANLISHIAEHVKEIAA